MFSMSPVRNPQCPPSQWWWQNGSWHTSNHDRKQEFGKQLGNQIWRTIKMSKMTHVLHVFCQEPSMSSKSLMMTGVSWHTFNHARKLKYGTNVMNYTWRTFKMSRILMSSMSPVRNPQSPPSHLRWWEDLDTILFVLEIWNLAYK